MDKIKPQSGFIQPNEVLLRNHHEWLYFSNPHQIIVVEEPKDVLPALREIERLIAVHAWHAAGFLSYEAASGFDLALQTRASATPSNFNTLAFPYLWFGLYSAPSVVTLPPPQESKENLAWQVTTDREHYEEAVAKIKGYIAEGKTYQVNYTIRLQSEFTGSTWNFFLDMVQNQNDYAAYLDIGRYVICSASPELFFKLTGDVILCRPMKGTAQRGRTTLEDKNQSNWLKDSEKNRAENVMIVDMIRNDLGKIANKGSIQVPHLFDVERYPTLWQMTSTVTAKTNAPLTDILAALFPCASVTGAPKVSTMKIIAELENAPRNIYTGAIGYMSSTRKASFNVAIRTMLIDKQNERGEYGIGGGVIWDSSSSDEYAEALLKARILVHQSPPFSLLETILWTPEDGFFLREKHIARLLDSAAYFDIPLIEEKLEQYLEEISSAFRTRERVRVLVDQAGQLSYESSPLGTREGVRALHVILAKEAIDSSNIFLFHKTTQREVYERAHKGFETFDDILLYNERGELTEFTIGNLVVELNGQLLTPPISCGVLAGTFRAYLIETAQIEVRTITIDEIKTCAALYRINSIRKWERADLQQPLTVRA